MELTETTEHLRILIRAFWPQCALGTGIKAVGIVGSTCAGKTDFCKKAAQLDIGESWLFLREVYGHLLLEREMRPPDPADAKDVLRVQAMTFLTQMLEEAQLARQARFKFKFGFVGDRPLPDMALFVHGKLAEMLEYVGIDHDELLQRYDSIIHLGVVPEEMYHAKRGQNPARPPEPYAEVLAREDLIRQIYGRHKRYNFVPFHTDWQTKLFQTRHLVFDRT